MCKLRGTNDVPGIPERRVLGTDGRFWLLVTGQHNLLLMEVRFMSGSGPVKSLIGIASQWEIFCPLYRKLSFR